MDYTSAPGTNQHPNKHDYNELVTIYTHLDSTTTLAGRCRRLAARALTRQTGAGA